MTEPEPLTVRWHEDGSLTADSWPECIAVEEFFIEQADPSYVRLDDGNMLRITLMNGEATYALGELEMPYRVYRGQRIRLVER